MKKLADGFMMAVFLAAIIMHPAEQRLKRILYEYPVGHFLLLLVAIYFATYPLWQ